MPLDATRFSVLNGHLIHQDILQFFNLLTGVMTDQPVTISNYVWVRGRFVTNNWDAGWNNNLGGSTRTQGPLWSESRLITNNWDTGWANSLGGNVIASGGYWAQDHAQYKLHGTAHVRTGLFNFGNVGAGQGTQVRVNFSSPMPGPPVVVLTLFRPQGNEPKNIVQIERDPPDSSGFTAHCQNLGEIGSVINCYYLAYWNE